MDKLKLVKAIVCLFTFLLVFGSLVALGNLYKKVNKTVEFPTAASLEEPVGSHIESFQKDKDLLYIHVKEGGQNDRIVIFNASRGKIISKINLN